MSQMPTKKKHKHKRKRDSNTNGALQETSENTSEVSHEKSSKHKKPKNPDDGPKETTGKKDSGRKKNKKKKKKGKEKDEGCDAKRLISEFPAKGWKKTTVNDFLKRLTEIDSTKRQSGSRRPRTVRTVANISAVNDLVLSQEDAPQMHHTTQQIVREQGIHHSSVV